MTAILEFRSQCVEGTQSLTTDDDDNSKKCKRNVLGIRSLCDVTWAH